MAKSQPNAVMQILPVIVTVLVVVGALVLARTSPPSIATDDFASSAVSALVTKSDEMIVVAMYDAPIYWTTATSSIESCQLPRDFLGVDRVTTAGVYTHSEDGRRKMFSLVSGVSCPPVAGELSSGMANPSDQRTAKIVDARADGAAVLQVFHGTEANEVTLRGKNSRPYHDARLLGWLDDNRLVVNATQGDTQVLLLVDTTGLVSELVKLPENAVALSVGAHAAWYVTYTRGEGIEQGPRGPSELHRVTSDGADAVVNKEADTVIELVKVGPTGAVSYATGAMLKLISATGTVYSVGDARKGTTLGWTDAGEVLIDREGALWAFSSEGVGREISPDVIKSGAVGAWILHGPLDAASANQ